MQTSTIAIDKVNGLLSGRMDTPQLDRIWDQDGLNLQQLLILHTLVKSISATAGSHPAFEEVFCGILMRP